MSDIEDSFNAEGPTVVAFETTDEGPRTFGVGVNGNNCGVHGEGMEKPFGPRTVKLDANVGVHGRGDSYGVYGVSGKIKPGDAPNFGPSAINGDTTRGGIGVVGVSDDVPGVIGASKITRKAFSPIAIDDLTTHPIGVVGISKEEAGVFGLSLPDATIATELFQEAKDALSDGAGVLGAGEGNRGGVFGSRATKGSVAQLRLVPLKMNFPQALPHDGKPGDFFVRKAGEEQTELWFCTQGASPPNGAEWARVNLVDFQVAP